MGGPCLEISCGSFTSWMMFVAFGRGFNGTECEEDLGAVLRCRNDDEIMK